VALKGSKNFDDKTSTDIRVTLSVRFTGTTKSVEFEVDEHPREFNETLESAKRNGFLSFLKKDGEVVLIPLNSILFLEYFSEVKQGKASELLNEPVTTQQEAEKK